MNNNRTTIYIDTDTKAGLEEIAKQDQRSLIDQLRWLVQMEQMRRNIRQVAEKELNK